MRNASTTWEELYPQLPEEFAPYALEFAWEPAKLWALDVPVEEMAVSELSWQLGLRWWRDGERYFAVRPTDVLREPKRYREQFERTVATNLSFPLDLTLRSGRWFILDGVHRLLRAVMLELPAVRVRKIPAEALDLFTV